MRSAPASPGSGPSRPGSPVLPETGSGAGAESQPPSPAATGGDEAPLVPAKMTKMSKEENTRKNIEMMRNLSRTGYAVVSNLGENEEDEVCITR